MSSFIRHVASINIISTRLQRKERLGETIEKNTKVDLLTKRFIADMQALGYIVTESSCQEIISEEELIPYER